MEDYNKEYNNYNDGGGHKRRGKRRFSVNR